MSAAEWLTSDAVTEALARIKQENEEVPEYRFWSTGRLAQEIQNAMKDAHHSEHGSSGDWLKELETEELRRCPVRKNEETKTCPCCGGLGRNWGMEEYHPDACCESCGGSGEVLATFVCEECE